MSKNYYCYLGGSNAYNLCIEESDKDIIAIQDNRDRDSIKSIYNQTNNFDFKYIPREHFLNLKNDLNCIYFFVFALYPKEVYTNNNFTKYFLSQKIEWIQYNKKHIYISMFEKAKNALKKFDCLWKTRPKHIMTSMRTAFTLARYAENPNIDNFIWIPDEQRNYFLDVRRKIISKEEAYDRFSTLMEKAEGCFPFYDAEVNKSYNEEFTSNLCDLLEVDKKEFAIYQEEFRQKFPLRVFND